MSDERRRRNAKRIAEQLFPVIAKSGGTIRSHFPWDRLPEIINGTYVQGVVVVRLPTVTVRTEAQVRTKSTIVRLNSRFSLLSIAQACRNQQYFYVDTNILPLYVDPAT
jgi:hypothetical protein